MLPLMFPSQTLPIGLIGAGEPLRKRAQMLQNSGCEMVCVWLSENNTDYHFPSSWGVHHGLPTDSQMAAQQIIFIAGMNESESLTLAEIARLHRVWVNVEDVRQGCDFFVPAQVQRGDLTFAVGTKGASPALARMLREFLEKRFDASWADHTAQLSKAREEWKNQGISPAQVLEKSKAWMNERALLTCACQQRENAA